MYGPSKLSQNDIIQQFVEADNKLLPVLPLLYLLEILLDELDSFVLDAILHVQAVLVQLNKDLDGIVRVNLRDKMLPGGPQQLEELVEAGQLDQLCSPLLYPLGQVSCTAPFLGCNLNLLRSLEL